MSTPTPKPPWRGRTLTPELANLLSPVEVRLFALVCAHAASATRVSLTTLGEIIGSNDRPLGPTGARNIVNRFFEEQLLYANRWEDIKDETLVSYRVAGMRAPVKVPRHLQRGIGRIPVGGRFYAAPDLNQALLNVLVSTGELISEHQTVPSEGRDLEWVATLATYTEVRAGAFTEWARIDATRVVADEARRLTAAAAQMKQQVENRRAAEQARHKPTP